MQAEHALLALGRLDGCLSYSSAARPWLVKARIEGAVAVACNAGVGVTFDDVERWLSGVRNPPRASEGLNDPLSVVGIIYFFFETLDANSAASRQPVSRLMHSILNHTDEANVWASGDLIRYGPLWQALRRLAVAPGLEPTISSVVDRMYEMIRIVAKAEDRVQLVATAADGRQLQFVPQEQRIWIVGLMIPLMLQNARITVNLIPSLVPALKMLQSGKQGCEEILVAMLNERVSAGFRTLRALEREMELIDLRYHRSKRSRLQLAAEIRLALPSLTRKKLAVAMGSTAAGAGYMLHELQKGKQN